MLDGRIVRDGSDWYYRQGNAKIGIHQTAEGVKKIAILHRLLGNKTLAPGSIIFVDEREKVQAPVRTPWKMACPTPASYAPLFSCTKRNLSRTYDPPGVGHAPDDHVATLQNAIQLRMKLAIATVGQPVSVNVINQRLGIKHGWLVTDDRLE